ncbi:F0F1 ATP synthase subunit epsilon [Tissierella praeacuta]|uniref:ATP synthase epsilon chain n=1 Tax=Tissierella praeacuta DSM 18095 TaxID=1123404 RepID=A0A1M4WG64_9FIRM|nr:F0F1 ATP synthase subunit epsilon [Tissierella praeacuta]TCU79051.1 ATP synthase F1 subcomplex epsilon subunit [Tissierella praeacuta]SHE80238.1 ATP synthase F1 subcomplex epsilon subunit [Tissierella praeacuta DSM 18095]SUO99457.1 F-ATPase epsilon subunit [Tissierella praeacuta]HAE91146.1 F0F1 ATP synthase subunit epsilon [Tissierella sp.]
MFYLDIVTPDKPFFSDEVEMVIVRGIEGDMAILEGRAPITTPLKIGKVRIFQNGEEKIAAVVDGYISVVDNKTTIVTEAAEWPHEIDVERAEAAKERAENLLKSEKDNIDIERAELALRRAINRLEVSNLKKFDE